MTSSSYEINNIIYQSLPSEYNSFKKPSYAMPFIVEKNGRKIDLNDEYLLNIAYSKIVDFKVEEKNITDTPSYFQALDGFINVAKSKKINVVGKEIDFFGDIWDFNEFKKKTQSSDAFKYLLRKHCNGLSNYYEITLRMYLFYAITKKGIESSGINSDYKNIKNVLYQLQANGINNLKYITVSDLELAIENPVWEYSTITKVKYSFKDYLTMYSLIFEDIYLKSIDDYLSNTDRVKLKSITEQNKTPLLPTEIFKKLETVLLRILKSDEYSIRERMQSGLILIDMQTGLRPSELVNLEKESLQIIEIDSKRIGILKYLSAKSRNRKEKTVRTIGTPIVMEVYEILKSFDPLNECKYIAFDDNKSKFRQENFSAILKKFCLNNCQEIGIINHRFQLSFSSTKRIDKAFRRKDVLRTTYPEGLNPNDKISFPSFIQFRVYFASELRARGVDDRTISAMLGQSVEMWGYYVRGAGEIQEEKKQIDELLKECINGQVNLLGPRAKNYESKIRKFFEKPQFKAEKDVNKLIDGLDNEIEIRIKKGGFCIHSNKRRSCQYDSDTDEFYCAYGCCPNHVHTYYSSPITYDKFKDAIKIIEYNKKSGFLRQTEKELKKLEVIINQELNPELNDLEVQLKKYKKEDIIKRHPDTKLVIDNLDLIKESINEWIKIIKNSDNYIKEN